MNFIKKKLVFLCILPFILRYYYVFFMYKSLDKQLLDKKSSLRNSLTFNNTLCTFLYDISFLTFLLSLQSLMYINIFSPLRKHSDKYNKYSRMNNFFLKRNSLMWKLNIPIWCTRGISVSMCVCVCYGYVHLETR